MGRRSGRGAALNAALAATLAAVAEILAEARDPWWVIGSAAVVLLGGRTEVRDVDVLLSGADARGAAARIGVAAEPGSDHPLFRSTLFFAWRAPPLPVEFMAGFAVRSGNDWTPVAPRTRERIVTGGGPVFVPARDEMRELLSRFGRPKDVERREALC